jgi:hypothetical protein
MAPKPKYARIVENEITYLCCNHEGCDYKNKLGSDMSRHVREKHPKQENTTPSTSTNASQPTDNRTEPNITISQNQFDALINRIQTLELQNATLQQQNQIILETLKNLHTIVINHSNFNKNTEPVDTPVDTPVETPIEETIDPPVETEPIETEPVETEPVETEPVEAEAGPSNSNDDNVDDAEPVRPNNYPENVIKFLDVRDKLFSNPFTVFEEENIPIFRCLCCVPNKKNEVKQSLNPKIIKNHLAGGKCAESFYNRRRVNRNDERLTQIEKSRIEFIELVDKYDYYQKDYKKYVVKHGNIDENVIITTRTKLSKNDDNDDNENNNETVFHTVQQITPDIIEKVEYTPNCKWVEYCRCMLKGGMVQAFKDKHNIDLTYDNIQAYRNAVEKLFEELCELWDNYVNDVDNFNEDHYGEFDFGAEFWEWYPNITHYMKLN